LPNVEKSLFDIDLNSGRLMPNGATAYDGVIVKTKENV